MRAHLSRILGLTAACCLLSTGVRAGTEELPWLQWHYAGTVAVKESPNAVTVKAIWDLPETRRIASTLINRLAMAPERQVFGEKASQAGLRPRLARGLITAALTHESIGALAGPHDGHPNLSIGIKLPLNKLDDWDRNIRRYLATLGWKAPEQNPENDDLDWTATHETDELLARFVKQKDWILFSVGSDAHSQLPTWNTQIAAGEPPSLPEKSALTVNGDAQELIEWLVGTPAEFAPRFNIQFQPETNGVRTLATLDLKQDITLPLPEWSVPKSVIHEPVVSFSGTRGLNQLLQQVPLAQPLVKNGLPEQFYTWSRPFTHHTNKVSIPVFPIYVGWPIAFEDISVAGLTKFLPEIVGPSIAESGSARLLSLPNRNETVLQMVPPFMQPFVLGRTNNLAGARVAGLFPIPQAPREPPQALFDQLNSKENLVYYHWEITQNKIELYRMLHQLLAFFFQKTQMNSKATSYRWLEAIESKMGNAVTLVTAKDESQLEVVRKSNFGLTALEIVTLARWLEYKSFPWLAKEAFDKFEMRSLVPPPVAPRPNAKARR